MTKCIVLSEQATENKKPIKFVWGLNTGHQDNRFFEAVILPKECDNIELISKAIDSESFDIMFAYHYDRNSGVIYLGYWNDGFVA